MLNIFAGIFPPQYVINRFDAGAKIDMHIASPILPTLEFPAVLEADLAARLAGPSDDYRLGQARIGWGVLNAPTVFCKAEKSAASLDQGDAFSNHSLHRGLQ
jgi:hypothetical protein